MAHHTNRRTTETAMEEALKNSHYLFIAVLIMLFVKFYRTYFGLFPQAHYPAGTVINLASDNEGNQFGKCPGGGGGSYFYGAPGTDEIIIFTGNQETGSSTSMGVAIATPATAYSICG